MSDDPARTAILGVVLAGGLSRRMAGADKALMPLAGKPLLAHVRDRLAPQVGRVVLNANGDPERFAAFGLPVQPDTIADHAGPLAGVLAGMRWAQANAPGVRSVATAATDTPFFPKDFVARLAQAGVPAEDVIAIAVTDGRWHPVFALWPVALADDLETFLRSGENAKVTRYVERQRFVEVAFPAGGEGLPDPFFNINSPEDLEIAERFTATGRKVR